MATLLTRHFYNPDRGEGVAVWWTISIETATAAGKDGFTTVTEWGKVGSTRKPRTKWFDRLSAAKLGVDAACRKRHAHGYDEVITLKFYEGHGKVGVIGLAAEIAWLDSPIAEVELKGREHWQVRQADGISGYHLAFVGPPTDMRDAPGAPAEPAPEPRAVPPPSLPEPTPRSEPVPLPVSAVPEPPEPVRVPDPEPTHAQSARQKLLPNFDSWRDSL